MNHNSAKNQKIKGKFIEREVVCCVSYLISELVKNEKYQEDLWPVCVKEGWDEPAGDFVNSWTREQCVECLEEVGIETSEGVLVKELRKRTFINIASTQEFCEENNLDPYIHEALEHWIVSDWLAEKLEEEGEMVLYDFMGLTIWGRTTTGQAIFLDGVIGEICSDMEILEGQANEREV